MSQKKDASDGVKQVIVITSETVEEEI